MLITKACPRCHGDLAHVDDVGDAYYSCVQCGHLLYGLTPAGTGGNIPVERSPRPALVPRDEVHRQRIRRRLAEKRVA